MGKQATDTAHFVISGKFESQTLINDIEKRIGQISRLIASQLSKVGTEVDRAIKGGSSKATADVTAKTKKDMKGLADGAKVAGDNTKGIGKNMEKVNADLFVAVKRVLLWGTASRAIYSTYGKIKDAVGDVVKLNKILVDIQKIRPAGLDTAFISEDIINKAKRFGVAFEEIGETQRVFYQQGFNTAEVSKLTEAQLLAVTAAGLSASEAMELLVGSMTIFNISADNSISLIDKLQNVQANFAVSTQDLSAAMRRVGPVAQQLGGDIDNLIGVITALKTTTRKSGEFIGTALSTIFSRMVTTRGANQLRQIGVDIQETALKIRPLKDILYDTAQAWDTLSTSEQIATSFALGGRRRYTQVTGLFQEYGIAMDAASVASNSFGAALIAQQKEVQSVSRQMAIASQISKEAGIAFVNAFAATGDINEDFRNFAKTLQNFGRFVEKNSKSFAKFVKIMGAVAIFATFKVTITAIAVRLAAVDTAAKLSAISLTSLQAAFAKATASGLAFRTALVSIAFNPWIVAIGLTISLLYGLNKAMHTTSNAVINLSDAYSSLGDGSSKALKTLKEYYEIAKQFKNVKGPEALIAFLGKDGTGVGPGSILGNLREIATISEDFDNVNFDKFKQALEGVGTETITTEQAFSDLSNIIGFLKATMGGIRVELEEIESGGIQTSAIITQLAKDWQRAFDPEDTAYQPRDLFAQVFGTNLEDFSKELKKFQVSVQGVDFSSISPDEYALQEYYKTLLGGNNIFATLENAGTLQAEVFSKSLFRELTKQAGGAKSEVINPWDSIGKSFIPTNPLDYFVTSKIGIDIEYETIQKEGGLSALEIATKEALDPALIQKEVDRLFADKGIDITKNLFGPQDLSEIKSISKLVSNYLEIDLPHSMETARARANPLVETLIKMQEAAMRTSESAGYFPKKMTTELKTIVAFSSDVKRFADNMEIATLKSIAFGKSLSTGQLSAIGTELNALITQVTKADNLDKKQESIQATIDVYEDYVKYLKRTKDDTDIDTDQAVLKTNDDITKLKQSLVEYAVDSDRAKFVASQLNSELIRQANVYQGLQQYISYVNNEFAIQRNSIKRVKDETLKGIKSLLKYQEAQEKIVSSFKKISSGGSFDFDIAIDVSALTRVFDLRKNAKDAEIALERETLALTKKNIKTKFDALNIDVANVDKAQELLENLKGQDKAETAQLLTAYRNADNKVKSLEISRSQLDVDEKRAVALVRLNGELKKQSAIHSANLASIQNYAKSIQESIGAVLEFNTAQQEMLSDFKALGTEGNYAAQLGIEIQKATASYNEQRQAISAEIALKKETIKLDKGIAQGAFDGLKVELERLGLAGDSLDIKQEEVASAENALNSIELAGRKELESLELKKKHLSIQEQYEVRLLNMNSLLDMAKDTHSDMNSLASGYANAVGDIVNNISELITQRGGLRTLLEPFADAYISSVTDRLNSALQGFFDKAMETSVGGQLKEIEDKLKQQQVKEPYEIGGEIIKLKMIEAGVVVGDQIAYSIQSSVVAVGGSTPTGQPQVSTDSGGSYFNTQPIVNAQQDTNRGLGFIEALQQTSLEESTRQTKELGEEVRQQKLIAAAVQSLGVIMGNLAGGGTPEGALGASIGGALGSLKNVYVGAFGSIFGGVIGKLFAKDEEEPEKIKPEVYQANSTALRQNTEALIKNTQNFDFMQQLINAPSNFIQPAYASLGGGAQITIEINAPVGNEQAVGKAVYEAVSKVYSNDSRRIGRRG